MSKLKIGRPRKYETAKELTAAMQDYFDSIARDRLLTDENGSPVLNNIGKQVVITEFFENPNTIGMCLHLGITSETLTEQELRGKEFSEPITRARQIILNRKLELLNTVKNPRGIMFDLSANYGMIERKAQEIDHNIHQKLEDFIK